MNVGKNLKWGIFITILIILLILFIFGYGFYLAFIKEIPEDVDDVVKPKKENFKKCNVCGKVHK